MKPKQKTFPRTSETYAALPRLWTGNRCLAAVLYELTNALGKILTNIHVKGMMTHRSSDLTYGSSTNVTRPSPVHDDDDNAASVDTTLYNNRDKDRAGANAKQPRLTSARHFASTSAIGDAGPHLPSTRDADSSTTEQTVCI